MSNSVGSVSAGFNPISVSAGGTYVPSRLPVTRNASPTPTEQNLRKAIQELLGQTFYAPMFKQMRESPFKDKMFSGGRGGEAFSAMLDQKLMTAVSRGSGRNLAEVFAKKLSKQAEHAEKVAAFRKADQAEFSDLIQAQLRGASTTLPTTATKK